MGDIDVYQALGALAFLPLAILLFSYAVVTWIGDKIWK